MEFYYRKANPNVISSLERDTVVGVTNVQNYIPIYQQLFKLNENNFNGIGLNSHYELIKILKNQEDVRNDSSDVDNDADPHYVMGEFKTTKGKRDSSDAAASCHERAIFIKFSPLLDPIKYLSGKYDITDNTLMALPQYGSTKSTCHPKVLDCNNSAYVDGFFTYLSSQVMNAHKFCHGIEYYGALIGHKQDFEINITDDIECFHDCGFFKANNGGVYTMDPRSRAAYERTVKYLYSDAHNADLNASMRNYKPRLVCKSITADDADIVITTDVLDDTIHTFFNPDSHMPATTLNQSADKSNESNESNETTDNHTRASASTNSSRSSNSTQCGSTRLNLDGGGCDFIDNIISKQCHDDDIDCDDDGENDGENDDGEDDDGEDDDDDDDDDGDEVYVQIKKFPVNMILMEECDDTLDSLLEDGVILSVDEWGSILMQIIMMLVAYQKMFWFTHNDLHTNNVMFVETDKPFLYYLYNGTHYRVPTYGKIFKIIDFGRAIYKYKSLTVCSDSFHPKGDAATQYNFEPYTNTKKPGLDPNPSFDLCRLACSLFDYFITDITSSIRLSNSDPIIALVTEWVKDDKGRNVLYKSNGVERYPNFKLYKMIARTVHKHVPAAQLSNPLFSKYAVLATDVSQKVKKTALMSIDDMPEYYV
jgi:hypothetical protein